MKNTTSQSECLFKIEVRLIERSHLPKTMNPITPEIIAEATRRIALELEPEEIIMFGSYAWGTPHKYSDLDLCVIVSDGIPGFNRIEWGVRGINAVNDLTIDVDVTIKTRSEIETFKTVPASLTRKIVEEGKMLYGQGKTSVSTLVAQESPTRPISSTKVG